jgi:predicted transcriptional regulator
MKVCDLMSYQPVAIDADDSVEEAAGRMRAHVVGALPVLDLGQLVGIVTDRDLAMRVVATGEHQLGLRVREVMTPRPMTCRRDDRLEVAIDRMINRHVRRIVVLDETGAVQGILSADDLVALDSTTPAAIRVVRASLPSRGELDGAPADVR